jgi:hypothetical protein
MFLTPPPVPPPSGPATGSFNGLHRESNFLAVIKFLRMESGRAVYEVGSGNYQFKTTIPDLI